MKNVSLPRIAVLSLACVAFLSTQAGLSAAEFIKRAKSAKTKSPPIIDVGMAPGGAIVGHVVDDRGIALDGAVVTLRQGRRVVAKTVTDKDGVFVAKGLRAGIYQLSAGQGSGTFRCWAPNTAPPSARSRVLIVSSRQVIRGQQTFGLDGVGGLDPGTLLNLGIGITTVTLTAINTKKIGDVEDDVNVLIAKSP